MTKTTLLKSEGRNIQTAVKFPETASSVSKSAQREVVNVSKPAFQPCTFQQGHRQLIGTDIAGCNLSSLKEEAVCSPRTLKDSSCPLLQSIKIVAPSRDCSVSQLDVSEVAHFPKTICPDPVGNIVHFETVPELLSPPVPAPRAARAQRSPPPVSVPRVGGAGVQLSRASLYTRPLQQFAGLIFLDGSHMLHSEFQFLPSGQRFLVSKCKTWRFKNSFVVAAITQMNKL